MKSILLIIACLCYVHFTIAQPATVEANGIRIAYESFGDENDPVIILINGTGAPMTDWPAALCKILSSKHFRVIRFDNRDIGYSTYMDSLGMPDWAALGQYIKTCKPAPLPYTLLDMASDVKSLMDALNIKKAHIAGASMGGAIAQLFTIHFPDRVLSLASIAASSGNPELPAGDPIALQAMATPPPVTNDPDSLSSYLIHIYKALGSTDDDRALKLRALESIHHSWHPEGNARQAAAVIIADNCDRRADLAKIRVPVVVIHGDADPIVVPQAGKEVAQAIPGAGLKIIKGMGHDLSEKFINEIADDIADNASRALR